MSEKIKLAISPAVAAYVRPGTSVEARLAGCEESNLMEPFERITLLFCLSKDAEQSVRLAAVAQIATLPEDAIMYYANSENANSLVFNTILKNRTVSPLNQPSSENVDLQDGVLIDPLQPDCDESHSIPLSEYTDMSDGDAEKCDDEYVDEETEQFVSKFKIAQMMGIGEKIKMALTGDKEWRSILVKDSNKLVSGSVVKNPRITESEVLQLIKSGIQNDEIMRLICSNKEWIKSYKIRKSLIENNRTPVQSSMRYLATMGEKDLAGFAKSKNISSVVSTMAKRLLLSKKR